MSLSSVVSEKDSRARSVIGSTLFQTHLLDKDEFLYRVLQRTE